MKSAWATKDYNVCDRVCKGAGWRPNCKLMTNVSRICLLLIFVSLFLFCFSGGGGGRVLFVGAQKHFILILFHFKHVISY